MGPLPPLEGFDWSKIQKKNISDFWSTLCKFFIIEVASCFWGHTPKQMTTWQPKSKLPALFLRIHNLIAVFIVRETRQPLIIQLKRIMFAQILLVFAVLCVAVSGKAPSSKVSGSNMEHWQKYHLIHLPSRMIVYNETMDGYVPTFCNIHSTGSRNF